MENPGPGALARAPPDPYSILACQYNENDLALQKPQTDDFSYSKKKDYTDMASVLISLSTFAGGLTIATQFIAQCPRSRVEALLAMASQLFLGTPLCLITVYLLLYGIEENVEVSYVSSLHALLVAQFVISGLLLSTAFILLGVAIFAAEVDGKVIGTWGLVLLSVFVGTAVLTGLLRAGVWNFVPRAGSNRIIWPSVWRAVPLLTVQLVSFGLLLGFGSRAASQAPIQNGCFNVTASAR